MKLHPSLLGYIFYHTGRIFFNRLFRWGWRMEVKGLESIPREGGLIFASNHVSNVDPPLVGCCIPRNVHFMAKQELFEIPVFGWVIRQINAFPIKRVERDIGAFKMAQRILGSGGTIILFPEGARQKAGRLGRAKAGVGMLARKTGARVVPVYVHNSDRLGKFQRPGVYFGPPLTALSDDYQAFSNEVMGAIASLKERYGGPQG